MLIFVLLGLVAGLAIGGAHFAGLRWTVQASRRVARPGTLLVASLVGRVLLTALVFLVILRFLGPVTFLASVGGFVLSRWLGTRGGGRRPPLNPEVLHPHEGRRGTGGLPDSDDKRLER